MPWCQKCRTEYRDGYFICSDCGSELVDELQSNELDKLIFEDIGKNYLGLDILRGIGIFVLIVLHSAFYYFGGLFKLDFENPPLIVTIIGLLLMFAGLFAIISGFVHNIQYANKLRHEYTTTNVLKHQLLAGFYILVIAYIYFIFTGPGIADFENQVFSNSIVVELIRNGRLQGIIQERLLYIDSLVMIGMNTLICGILSFIVSKTVKEKKKQSKVYFILAIFVFILSMIRIPLYEIYLKAVEENNYLTVLLLNWLVNKNNPIFPFLSFGIFGMWFSSMLQNRKLHECLRIVIGFGITMLLLGALLYIKLPDTMLERAIDFKWYSIMVAQIGLFLLLMVLAIYLYDARAWKTLSFSARFFYRFGVAGLTPFFLESIISAFIYRVIVLINPEVSFNITQSLVYGLALAIGWGIVLMLWEKRNYRYGLEYLYAKITSRYCGSSKGEKLEDKTWQS